MVRLFIPEGEGQHALTVTPPITLAIERDIVASPWRSSIAAAAITGGLALVGRSRPGVFLKSAALFSAVDLTWTASGIYGRHELNRGVFKMEGIQPKPGKLWGRTKRWTVEDATLGGGMLGTFMALNPRALPGVYGFARFLGAATVGCALGFKAGQTFIVRLPPALVQLFDQTMTATRQQEYQKLQDNDKAKASLSRIGKLALWYHTSQLMAVLRSPLGIGGIPGAPMQPPPDSPLQALKDEMERETVIQVAFKEGELAGPDIDNGVRVYKDDDLKARDASTIQDRLEKVQDLKQTSGSELQYVWRYLAQKEHEFYQHVEEDRAKDILRRELQLLNSMAADLVARYAIFGYHEHDAQKQLQQIELAKSSAGLDAVSEIITTPYETPHHSGETTQSNNDGPHSVTERTRIIWSRQKELLRHLEESISRGDALGMDGASHFDEYIKRLRGDAESMRKNIEATERLLRWFEDRVREADDLRVRKTATAKTEYDSGR